MRRGSESVYECTIRGSNEEEGREVDRQAGRQAGRQTDRHTNRQIAYQLMSVWHRG